jgi:hypothetical protein
VALLANIIVGRTVTDSVGAVLHGATVRVTNTATRVSSQQQTTASGSVRGVTAETFQDDDTLKSALVR